MTILYVLYWASFFIAVMCFIAIHNIDVRRWYGRIFNTRIDTKIYNDIFYYMVLCVFALYGTIMLMG